MKHKVIMFDTKQSGGTQYRIIWLGQIVMGLIMAKMNGRQDMTDITAYSL